MFAKGVAGACVVLEHRYFGKSLPYKDLSEKHLQVLTIQQSIEDLAYFAQKVKLPAPIGYAHPDTNPWVIVGSGYAGEIYVLAWVACLLIQVRHTCELGDAEVCRVGFLLDSR